MAERSYTMALNYDFKSVQKLIYEQHIVKYKLTNKLHNKLHITKKCCFK